jgi:two-component system sensor histidine kinase UhpB
VSAAPPRMTPLALASPRRTLPWSLVRADDESTEGSRARRSRRGGAGRIRVPSVSVAVARALRRERRRIAADLHDEIGQAMAAARYNLELLEAWARGGPREVRRILHDTTRIVSRTLAETRRIAADLQPFAIDASGLEPAMRDLLRVFSRRTGATTRFVIEGGALPLCQDAQALLFRILQESLTNVATHARARSVAVRLVCSEHGMVMSIADDGIGLVRSGGRAVARDRGGLGLSGMRRRVRDVGGALLLTSTGRGTRLVVTLRPRQPLPGTPGEVR